MDSDPPAAAGRAEGPVAQAQPRRWISTPPRKGVHLALRVGYLLALAALLAGFIVGIPPRYRWLSSGMIGVSVSRNPQGQIVLRPVSGGAAYRAGVRTGDALVEIGGMSLSDSGDLPQALQLMPGPPGTPLEVRVLTPQGHIRSLTIIRDGLPLEALGITAEQFALVLTAAGVLLVLGFSVPALIIAARRTGDWMAALVSLTLILIAVYNSRAAGWVFLPTELTSIVRIATHVAILLMLLSFPDGRFTPRWTRWFFLLGVGWILIKTLPNPLGIALWASHMWIVLDALVFGVGVGAQVYRYRRSTDLAARQQAKWLTFGFVVAFAALYAYSLPLELIPRLGLPTVEGVVFQLAGTIVGHLVTLFVPVAFTYAVLRYRLFEIDLIINRTLVYVPLSAILAGVYTASIILLRSLLLALTGESSNLAIFTSTLIIVAIATPLKDQLQTSVDRRFKESGQPTRVLRDFELQVRERMHAVHAVPIMRRLLEQAAKAFGARGGAAYVGGPENRELVHTCGQWSGSGVIEVPVRSRGSSAGTIVLEARESGKAYSAFDLELLRQVAETVAVAIEQDRGL